MTLQQKMKAVVDAARSALFAAPGAYERLSNAVAALDAHTEAEEVVTLAVWEHADGDLRLARIGTAADNWAAWTRLGTVTLPLTPEGAR